MYESAEAYLKNTFGISEDIETVYCSYSKNSAGDGVDLNLMNFYFVKSDGIAYKISFSGASMELYTYEIKDYEKTVKAATANPAGASTERIEIKLK